MDGDLYYRNRHRRKGLDLDSPFHFACTKATGTYLHSPGFITAKINLDRLKIYAPGPSRMTVRVTDAVSSHPASTATVADIRHL